MAQPMLQITTDTAAAPPPPVTPHLLPCRIHHSGPIGPVDAYWAPKTLPDGTQTAYFRGRKLHGRTVHLPAGYRGVVGVRRASPRENEQQQQQQQQAREQTRVLPEVIDLDASAAEQAAQRQQRDTGVLAAVAAFDGVVVWGHEQTADAAADPYVRGLDEWLAVSEEIHSYE